MNRVKNGEMIAGVCTGMAKYYGWDVHIIRLIFFVLVLIGFPAGLVYLFFWIFYSYE